MRMGSLVACLVVAILIGAPPQGRGQEPQAHATGLEFSTEAELEAEAFAPFPLSAPGQMPKKVDLSVSCPPAGQQGRQSSCVAWAIAYGLVSMREKDAGKYDYCDPALSDNLRLDRVFSPAYLYYFINGGRDKGASLLAGLQASKGKGAAKWSAMPYDETRYMDPPKPGVAAGALKPAFQQWGKVDSSDLNDVRGQLAAGLPIVFGAAVDDSFDKGKGTGWVWQGPPKGATTSGHALLAVGYDDVTGSVTILNSWGKAWGDRGFGKVSYAAFTDRKVVRDAFVVHDVLPVVTMSDWPPSAPEMFSVGIDDSSTTTAREGQDGKWSVQLQGNVKIPGWEGLQGHIQVRLFTTGKGGDQAGERVRAAKGWTAAGVLVDNEGFLEAQSRRWFVLRKGGAIERSWTASLPCESLDLSQVVPAIEGTIRTEGQDPVVSLFMEPELVMNGRPSVVGERVRIRVRIPAALANSR